MFLALEVWSAMHKGATQDPLVKSSCLEDVLHFQVTVLDWGPQRQGLLLCRYQTQRQKDLSNLNSLNNTAMTNSDKQTTSWIGSNRDTSNRNMTSILGTPAFVHASASPVMTGTRRSCSPLFGKIYHSWSLDILRRPYLQTHLAWNFQGGLLSSWSWKLGIISATCLDLRDVDSEAESPSNCKTATFRKMLSNKKSGPAFRVRRVRWVRRVS